MQIWSNTTTLDGYVDSLEFTTDKATADVALVGGKAIDLAEFPRLRGIFKTGVGRDNVPEVEAAARGIACGFPAESTREIIFQETADFSCHLILRCLYADIGDFAAWKKKDRPALASRKLLVIGAGNIGGKVASKMRAFVKVTTFDTQVNKAGELEPLMREADCISLHVPLAPSTRDFIDGAKLSWMKPGSWLVNTARGAVVSEDALFDAVQSGRIGAAFDVFWQEPYKGKLLQLPGERFIVSPHVASTCTEFLSATAADFHAFMKGLTPR